MTSLRNRDISELLCAAAEQTSHTDQQRRALRRAGRAAYRWPEEAAALADAGRSLAELRAVGPWLAHVIGGWLAESPRAPEPPATREHFLTRTEVASILERAPAGEVRGDLQAHTVGSDGRDSVRAMAEAAAARGLAYLAITDHSKGLAIAGGMDETALARQGDEIRALNDELGASHPGFFRILRGVEMNLTPSGSGDLDPEFLGTFEIALGAFHSRLRVKDDQTERYLAALDYPGVHVLAHPRGRIFNFRLGLRADWPRVFERARRNDRAVEIDGYPDRQDLDVELLQLARETGVRISIGSDAHATDQLAALDYGIAAARLAAIPAERIVNCMSADELVAWTRSSGSG